jgi:hypothetical protein
VPTPCDALSVAAVTYVAGIFVPFFVGLVEPKG